MVHREIPMTRYTLLILALLPLPLWAQTQLELKKPSDTMRTCINPDTQTESQAAGADPILSNKAIGTNPQEGQYRQSMENLLRMEIANVRVAVSDIVSKHKELIDLYPSLKEYQEIIIEDVPGAWREGQYVNSKRVLSLGFANNGDIKCVVLDSTTRAVYNPDQWTRKLMRLYYPNVQTMELETLRHNYRMHGTLEKGSPEIQLRALRLIYQNLRTALYSMDMMIAAYYNVRNKKNEWQINM
mgnify:CR=1 FL=1